MTDSDSSYMLNHDNHDVVSIRVHELTKSGFRTRMRAYVIAKSVRLSVCDLSIASLSNIRNHESLTSSRLHGVPAHDFTYKSAPGTIIRMFVLTLYENAFLSQRK